MSKELRNFVVTLVGTVILSYGLFVLPIDYSKLGGWGYVGVFLAVLVGSATIIFPTPAFAASFLAGRFLNPYFVGIIAGIAATIGELVGYFLGYETSSLIQEKPFYSRIHGFVKKFGFFFLVFFAMIPNPLFDVAGIAAGTMKVPLWKFVLAVFIGKIIRFTAFALGGNILR